MWDQSDPNSPRPLACFQNDANTLTPAPRRCPRPSDAPPQENLPPGIALPAGLALPTGARELEDAGRRNSVGKAKGKAKKPDGCPSTDSDLEVSAWPAVAARGLLGRDVSHRTAAGTRTCGRYKGGVAKGSAH